MLVLYHKNLDCNMFTEFGIIVRVPIGEKCFCQKKLRTTHQQGIAEVPFCIDSSSVSFSESRRLAMRRSA